MLISFFFYRDFFSCGDKVNLNVTGGYICNGKFLVHISENEYSYELDCNVSILIELVQRFIESRVRIQFNDQLLLCGDMRVESNKVLGAYKLLSNE